LHFVATPGKKSGRIVVVVNEICGSAADSNRRLTMIRSSQPMNRTCVCALIAGLALSASAWAGPLAAGGFGAGAFGGAGIGRNVAGAGFGAGGYGDVGVGRGVAAEGMAGASGQFEGRIAAPTKVTQRVRSDVNGAAQTGARAAGQARTDVNGAAQTGAWAAGQARTDVNGSMQSAGRAAGQVDASTTVAGSASARHGGVQASGSASGQANAEADVRH
jgi:hypothetical protein